MSFRGQLALSQTNFLIVYVIFDALNAWNGYSRFRHTLMNSRDLTPLPPKIPNKLNVEGVQMSKMSNFDVIFSEWEIEISENFNFDGEKNSFFSFSSFQI